MPAAELRRRLLSKHVLVSGSARGTATSEKRISGFAYALGRMLIRKGYTIVCGLNPAVGRPVINGALDELVKRRQQRAFSERVRVWPLPTGRAVRKPRFDYRQEMAAVGGIGVFIAGKTGTQTEYEIFAAPSQEHGGFESGRADQVVPVGAFGGTGRSLWNERRSASADTDPDLRDDFRVLGDAEASDADLVGAVGRFVDVLSSASQ